MEAYTSTLGLHSYFLSFPHNALNLIWSLFPGLRTFFLTPPPLGKKGFPLCIICYCQSTKVFKYFFFFFGYECDRKRNCKVTSLIISIILIFRHPASRLPPFTNPLFNPLPPFFRMAVLNFKGETGSGGKIVKSFGRHTGDLRTTLPPLPSPPTSLKCVEI